jgi:cyclohexanone monooxygenase
MLHYQMRHMDRLFGEVRRRNAITFEVTQEANARFRDRMRKMQHNTLLYRADCAGSRSYYFSPHGEAYLRPTSTRKTIAEQTCFPLTDYVFA